MNSTASFIVPVYNDGKYIERCLNSILSQSFENWEAIVIDDGSNDESPGIIDKFAKMDSRFIVLHKNRGGVSAARNYGIQNAKGSYFLFVDGDDWIEPDYATYLIGLAEYNNCDMAVSSHHFNPRAQNQVKQDNTRIVHVRNVVKELYLGKLDVAVWNKVYSAEFIRKKNILFNPNIWYGEGLLFNIECLCNTSRVVIGERKIYHQEFNPNSAMRSFKLENQHCGMNSMEIQKDILTKFGIDVSNEWLLHYRLFYTYILKGLIQNNMIESNGTEYNDCIWKLHSNYMLPLVCDIPLKRKVATLVSYLAPVSYVKRQIKREQKSRR